VENSKILTRESGQVLPTQLMEDLILYYQQAGNEVDDQFLLSFHNRLRKLRLRNSSVTTEGLSELLQNSHPLYELELSNCKELTGELLPVINDCGENLHTLILGPDVPVLSDAPHFISR